MELVEEVVAVPCQVLELDRELETSLDVEEVVLDVHGNHVLLLVGFVADSHFWSDSDVCHDFWVGFVANSVGLPRWVVDSSNWAHRSHGLLWIGLLCGRTICPGKIATAACNPRNSLHSSFEVACIECSAREHFDFPTLLS